METQNQRVLALLRGGPLTSLEAMRLNPPIVHLARRIKDLRDLGHDVSCEMVYYRSEDGAPRKYGIYSLRESMDRKQSAP